MKIISQFKDYYDNAIQDHESTYVYVRKTEVLDETTDVKRAIDEKFSAIDPPVLLNSREGKNKEAIYQEAFYIAFCGKIYPGVRLVIFNNTPLLSWSYVPDPTYASRVITVYDFKSYEKLLNEYGLSAHKKQNRYLVSRYRHYRGKKFHDPDTVDKLWDDTGKDVTSLMLDHKTPVIMCSVMPAKIQVMKNPCLKDYEFFRVMNPVLTYQEVDMFVSGMLAPENKPMITVEDKYKIMEHGFNKWSFRKQPEKKKGL